MSVHYKFKSTLNFDTVTFDGVHISVGDLKKEIVHQKRLGKITDFDLRIINAQTKEVYIEDSKLIPKNTSLIIARIPINHYHKKSHESHFENSRQIRNVKAEGLGVDISKMKGSEEEKIQEMMHQSVADYDPNSYVKLKGQCQSGDVPPSYRCNKCKKGGHWIKNCLLVTGKSNPETKRNTGIPKSFRDKDENAAENNDTKMLIPEEQTIQNIPDELICNICKDIFVDAVMIPCCGSSFCDDCVRTALLESDENMCPDCKEKGCSPTSLIPNRFLRNSVNIFKNETGYKTAAIKPEKKHNVKLSETENISKDTAVPAVVEDTEYTSHKIAKPVTVIENSSKNSEKTEISTEPVPSIVQIVPQNKWVQNEESKIEKRPRPSSNNFEKLPIPSDTKNFYQPIPIHTQECKTELIMNHSPHFTYTRLLNDQTSDIGYSHYSTPFYDNPPIYNCQNELFPPVGSLPSVYKSIREKVGSGIIDDPLEAFNRLMKEKEKRQEERHRSLNHQNNSKFFDNSKIKSKREYFHKDDASYRDNRRTTTALNNHNSRNMKYTNAQELSPPNSYKSYSKSYNDRSNKLDTKSSSRLPIKRVTYPFRETNNEGENKFSMKKVRVDKESKVDNAHKSVERQRSIVKDHTKLLGSEDQFNNRHRVERPKLFSSRSRTPNLRDLCNDDRSLLNNSDRCEINDEQKDDSSVKKKEIVDKIKTKDDKKISKDSKIDKKSKRKKKKKEKIGRKKIKKSKKEKKQESLIKIGHSSKKCRDQNISEVSNKSTLENNDREEMSTHNENNNSTKYSNQSSDEVNSKINFPTTTAINNNKFKVEYRKHNNDLTSFYSENITMNKNDLTNFEIIIPTEKNDERIVQIKNPMPTNDNDVNMDKCSSKLSEIKANLQNNFELNTKNKSSDDETNLNLQYSGSKDLVQNEKVQIKSKISSKPLKKKKEKK